jgi:adenine phosphoribosyltransferase
LATGGNALGAIKLIEAVGSHVSECVFVIDLPDHGGRKKLEDTGHHVFTLIDFDGE